MALPSLHDMYDEILVIADSFLNDESPVSKCEDWAFGIDDVLLQLKLWGQTIGVDQGLFEDITLDKDLDNLTYDLLQDVLNNVQEIEPLARETDTVQTPPTKSKIAGAIERFRLATGRLTSTVELFRNVRTKLRNEGYLQQREYITRSVSQQESFPGKPNSTGSAGNFSDLELSAPDPALISGLWQRMPSPYSTTPTPFSGKSKVSSKMDSLSTEPLKYSSALKPLKSLESLGETDILHQIDTLGPEPFKVEGLVVVYHFMENLSCTIYAERFALSKDLVIVARRTDGKGILYHSILDGPFPCGPYTAGNNSLSFSERQNLRFEHYSGGKPDPERPREQFEDYLWYHFQNPADCIAMQELIYGSRLIFSCELGNIKSNRGLESSYSDLRLWANDKEQGQVTLMYYGRPGYGAPRFREVTSEHFEPIGHHLLGTRDNLLLHYKTETKGEESMSSSFSNLRIAPHNEDNLEFLYIEFKSLEDKRNFIEHWPRLLR